MSVDLQPLHPSAGFYLVSPVGRPAVQPQHGAQLDDAQGPRQRGQAHPRRPRRRRHLLQDEGRLKGEITEMREGQILKSVG